MSGSTDQHRRRWARAGSSRVVWVLLVGALAFAIAGCGGASKSTTSTSGAGQSGTSATGAGGKKGGTITVLMRGDVDYLDPGLTYYDADYMVFAPVNRPLYSYRAGSADVIPDIAASMPIISKDGKTVTVHIRKGVYFAPPVNREVTSADVKYAIERGFAESVPCGYAGVYFSIVKGAPKTPPLTPKPISGIQTPDKYTIVFKLATPATVFNARGIFTGALAMPLTSPVPQEYAKKFDDKKQSDYGLHQIATGPYMVKADKSGNVNGVGYVAARHVILVRNPRWNPKTDFRPAYADKIVFSEGFEDPTVASKKILAGTGDVNGDFPPSPTELRSILSNPAQKKLLYFTPTDSTRYVPMNTRKPPFTDVHVRRAVAWVLDRNAMRLTRGGPVDGEIATHFIDPGFGSHGFDQAGGFSYDPFATPNNAGSVAKAKAELKLAAKDPKVSKWIDAKAGMYKGPAISMVADNSLPGSDTAKVVAHDLAKIGMTVRIVSVTHTTMYTVYCNVPKKEPDICPNVGWVADFKEPQTLLDATFNGKAIVPQNNSNWPLLNDPKINAAMDKAELIVSDKQRWQTWANIDHMITETAVAVPWIWENQPDLFSPRVIPAVQVWNAGEPDVAFMSVKPGK